MKIEYRRINHVTIAVPAGEHKKVREFYGGVLGLKEVERPDALNKVYDLIWYEWMDILLHLDFTPPWTKPAENRHVAVEVEIFTLSEPIWINRERKSWKPSRCLIASAFTCSILLETTSR